MNPGDVVRWAKHGPHHAVVLAVDATGLVIIASTSVPRDEDCVAVGPRTPGARSLGWTDSDGDPTPPRPHACASRPRTPGTRVDELNDRAGLTPVRGLRVDSAAAQAVGLLEAIERGEPVGARIDALVRAVLDHDAADDDEHLAGDGHGKPWPPDRAGL